MSVEKPPEENTSATDPFFALNNSAFERWSTGTQLFTMVAVFGGYIAITKLLNLYAASWVQELWFPLLPVIIVFLLLIYIFFRCLRTGRAWMILLDNHTVGRATHPIWYWTFIGLQAFCILFFAWLFTAYIGQLG